MCIFPYMVTFTLYNLSWNNSNGTSININMFLFDQYTSQSQLMIIMIIGVNCYVLSVVICIMDCVSYVLDCNKQLVCWTEFRGQYIGHQCGHYYVGLCVRASWTECDSLYVRLPALSGMCGALPSNFQNTFQISFLLILM